MKIQNDRSLNENLIIYRSSRQEIIYVALTVSLERGTYAEQKL